MSSRFSIVAAVERSQVISSIVVVTAYIVTSELLIAFGTSKPEALCDDVDKLDGVLSLF